MKILIPIEGERTYLLKDISKDFHCAEGMLDKKDLEKTDEIIESNKGKKFLITNPSFIDKLSKIKRLPQIIPRKDVGLIISETGIGKDSIVVDAGAGSGALALQLANIVKKITTYEIREDHYNVVCKNIELMGFKNIKIKQGNICEKLEEKNVDLITLDMPDPWNALENVKKALKMGGFVVSYSPTIPQVMDFVSALDGFILLKVTELMEREWECRERKVRPKSRQIGHSGFLTFARKI